MNPARAFGPAAVSGWLKDNAGTHAVSIITFNIADTCGINISFSKHYHQAIKHSIACHLSERIRG